MKPTKLVTGAEALALGALVSLGSIGCLITGFSLSSLCAFGTVALLALLLTGAGVVCFSFRRGGFGLLALLALLGGYLWQEGSIVRQTESLLFQISLYYDSAYNTGVIYWSGSAPADPVTLPLGLWAGLTGLLTARTVCRSRRMLPLLPAALLPLAACLVVTDTPPSPAPLFCLLAGLLIVMLSQAVRRRDPRQGSLLTALLALPAAAGLLALFLAVPQAGYHGQENAQALQDSLLGMARILRNYIAGGDLNVGINSGGGNVNLRTLGPMGKLDFRVMDVTADRGGSLYLRSRDYDLYTGTGWQSSRMRRDEDFKPADGCLEPAGDVTIRTVGAWNELLLPYYPQDGTVLIGGSAANTENSTTYTITRQALREDWSSISLIQDDADFAIHFGVGEVPSPSTSYLTLPTETTQWARACLDGIPAFVVSSTTATQVDAIVNYVRGSAVYDLDTARMPGDAEDFARWFLEESDTGYCVHFATATAVLLRAAGIPARYVEGYLVDARAGQTVTVTAGDAHAWVEYYEYGVGWIPLEATPGTGDAPAGTEERGTVPRETEAPEDTTAPSTLPRETGQAIRPTEEKPAVPEETADWIWLWRVLTVLGILAGGVVLVLGQWQLRLRLRRRKRPTANAQALALWQEVARAAKYLKEEPPEALEELARKAKFSQHTLSTEELARFDAWLESAHARLRGKPWYVRLCHRLVLALY